MHLKHSASEPLPRETSSPLRLVGAPTAVLVEWPELSVSPSSSQFYSVLAQTEGEILGDF